MTILEEVLEELVSIINRARERSNQVNHGPEIKWLLELPLTEDEWKRLNRITKRLPRHD